MDANQHNTLIDRDSSVLLVIDVQEKLAPAIDGADALVARITILGQAAVRLSVPVAISEQYPKGLGHTLPGLAGVLGDAPVIEKLHFSCADVPAISDWLQSSGRGQVVVCGMEAHVCVLQSALGLVRAGYTVFAVADAIGSRAPQNRDLAIERMRAAGISIVSTEMVLFEWLAKAGTGEFRDLSKLIR